MKRFFVAILRAIIVLAGAGVILGCVFFSQIKSSLVPTFKIESIDSYCVNIANAVADGRDLEIPPQILSGILSEVIGAQSFCVITKENKLKVGVKKAADIFGKVDVALTLSLVSFDPVLGELVFGVDGVDLGAFKCPAFLRDKVLENFVGFKGEGVTISGKRMRIAVGQISVNMLGKKINASPQNIYISGEKLYFRFK